MHRLHYKLRSCRCSFVKTMFFVKEHLTEYFTAKRSLRQKMKFSGCNVKVCARFVLTKSLSHPIFTETSLNSGTRIYHFVPAVPTTTQHATSFYFLFSMERFAHSNSVLKVPEASTRETILKWLTSYCRVEIKGLSVYKIGFYEIFEIFMNNNI